MLTSAVIATYIDGRYRRDEIALLTARTLRSNLGLFARQVDDPAIQDLSRDHIEAWLGAVKLAPSTKRTRLSQVRTFCHWALAHDYLERDPTLCVRGPRQPQLVPRGMSRAEMVRILRVCPDVRAMLIVLLMVQEGLRRCEVAGLAMGDIDFGARLVLVTGKGGHQRVLPLSEETWAALESYLVLAPATAGPLVRNFSDGRSALAPVTVGRMVSNIMGEAGVKVRAYDGRSAHALRHTAASDMVRSGAHLRDVQAALGHRSIVTTQRYLPWLVGDLRTAMGGRSYAGA